MDKAQAIHQFWKQFDLPAYDENTVPTDTEFPYLTYSVSTDSIGNLLALSASLWYRSPSWKDIQVKTYEIENALASTGYAIMKLDEGYVWFVKGTPFAQRMSDPEDDMIRRMYLNVTAEFLTAI